MKHQHTAGPWLVFPIDSPEETKLNYIERLRVGPEEGTHTVVCLTNGGHANATAEERANAHLIAAAPELLAALQEINKLSWHPESAGSPTLSNTDRWKIVTICRDAFSKAKGEA